MFQKNPNAPQAPQPKALPMRERLKRNQRKPKRERLSPLQTAIIQKRSRDGENPNQ